MTLSTYAPRRLRMKPLAAGLAMVLATGTCMLPVSSIASTPGNTARTALAWPGLTAAHPSLQAIMAGQPERHRARVERVRTVLASTSPQSTQGTTTVTNCNDSGSGSLRDAVMGASSGDTIDLSALTCSTITLTSGAVPVAQDDLSIVGPGADQLRIDGNATDSIFLTTGSGTFSVSGLTLTNAYAYDYLGGAITALYDGNVTLQGVVISDCETYSPVGNHVDVGGAAVATYYGGNVTLTDSTISHNRSTGFWALGALAATGAATITRSIITGNQSNPGATGYASFGGGVATDGMVTMTDSILTQNEANGTSTARGGGIYARQGLNISNSTISGNSAVRYGGGIMSLTGVSVINSTISGNHAGDTGAGMFIANYDIIINNSTISGNINHSSHGGAGITSVNSAPILINSSIVYGNQSAGSNADIDQFDPAYSFSITGANNIIGAASVPTPGDTLSVDPLLGPLQDNGGPSFTHALGAGSPAIDAGSNPLGLATDQRGSGFARVSGAAADIGAFEVQRPTAQAVAAVPANTTWALGLLSLLLGGLGWLGLGRMKHTDPTGR